MAEESFFRKKKVTSVFAAFALIAGFIFLNKDITGNVVLTEVPGFDIISFLGLLLVFCSASLAIYTVKKK